VTVSQCSCSWWTRPRGRRSVIIQGLGENTVCRRPAGLGEAWWPAHRWPGAPGVLHSQTTGRAIGPRPGDAGPPGSLHASQSGHRHRPGYAPGWLGPIHSRHQGPYRPPGGRLPHCSHSLRPDACSRDLGPLSFSDSRSACSRGGSGELGGCGGNSRQVDCEQKHALGALCRRSSASCLTPRMSQWDLALIASQASCRLAQRQTGGPLLGAGQVSVRHPEVFPLSRPSVANGESARGPCDSTDIGNRGRKRTQSQWGDSCAALAG